MPMIGGNMMKLVVYVMNDVRLLEQFLKDLNDHGIKGATIIPSTGMARKLSESDDMRFIGTLKSLFDHPRIESNVILIVLPDDLVDEAYRCIERVAGDMTQPNSGIVLTLPIDHVKGYKC
jgi:nitrogen regulatory protein PII